MKITYNTTGFLNDGAYNEAMNSFLLQYDGRFPGLNYLHLELVEVPFQSNAGVKFIYSPSGNGLKIYLGKSAKYNSKGKCVDKPSSFEIYNELRNLFDGAVEEHLKNHQSEFRYEAI